jgi:hypothetical protein
MPPARYLRAVLALSAVLRLQAAPQPRVFYVATNGSDANSGGSNAPFATLERARDAVRELKRTHGGKLDQPVNVLIHGGVYRLTQPLQFAPEDSGTLQCPITYAAFENDRPVLSGGRIIAGWKPATVSGRKLWVADLPAVREGKWNFRELWVNGERRQRARNPNRGFFRITGVPDMKVSEKYNYGQERFQFAPGEIGQYENPEDVELVIMGFWLSTRLGIANLDAAQNMVTLSRRSTFRLTDGFGRQPALGRYYVENAFELLDAPGEWYLNRKTGKLYYMPMPGEEMQKVEAVAPALESLVRFDGDARQGRMVEYLAFRGIGFEHAEWWVPRDDPHSQYQRQASAFVPAAIQLHGARGCSFESCTVKHISQYAIEFSSGSEHGRVAHCEMSDLGAGGIKVGEPDTDPRLLTHDIEIADNHIHHGGRTFHQGHAIWIGHSFHNMVEHNDVHDFFQIAISLGWSWTYSNRLAHDNVVEYNHVHHIGGTGEQGGLSDHGAIYTLGVMPGTVIRYNLLHDITTADYGGSGVYLDMGSGEILVEKNIVYRTASGSFHQNYGKNNVVRNNIFVLGHAAQIELGGQDGALPGHNNYLFERNVVYWSRDEKFLASPWNNVEVVFKKNLYWHDGMEPKFGPLNWAQWQAKGMDADSAIADPMFVDPAHDDFRLKPQSPAFQLGFEAFDLTGVGPRNIGMDTRR